jgi:hypothetical protein
MRRRRLPALALFVALAACEQRAVHTESEPTNASEARVQAPPSLYSSLTGKFEYQLPGAWSTSVRIIEEPGVSAEGMWPGVVHVVHFVYQPVGPGAKAQTLLSILAYDADRLGGRGAPAGTELARSHGRLFSGVIAAGNPYAVGTPDHDPFAALLPNVNAVKGAFIAK